MNHEVVDPVTVERELVRLAVAIALEAPFRQGAHSFGCSVQWDTIHALRAQLELHGVDWRAHHPRNPRRPR